MAGGYRRKAFASERLGRRGAAREEVHGGRHEALLSDAAALARAAAVVVDVGKGRSLAVTARGQHHDDIRARHARVTVIFLESASAAEDVRVLVGAMTPMPTPPPRDCVSAFSDLGGMTTLRVTP